MGRTGKKDLIHYSLNKIIKSSFLGRSGTYYLKFEKRVLPDEPFEGA